MVPRHLDPKNTVPTAAKEKPFEVGRQIIVLDVQFFEKFPVPLTIRMLEILSRKSEAVG